jgi:hypothetical protein
MCDEPDGSGVLAFVERFVIGKWVEEKCRSEEFLSR